MPLDAKAEETVFDALIAARETFGDKEILEDQDRNPLTYTGLIHALRLTAGVRNLFDRDPPFAITYDSNTGAGSSWEPRVADPRGRSFVLAAEMTF